MADQSNNDDHAIISARSNRRARLPWYYGLELPLHVPLPANVMEESLQFMGRPLRRNFLQYLLSNIPGPLVDTIVDFGVYKECTIVVSASDCNDDYRCRFINHFSPTTRVHVDSACNSTHSVVLEISMMDPIKVKFRYISCNFFASGCGSYNEADAAIFMFSCKDRRTYGKISFIYREFCGVNGKDLPVVVCGANSGVLLVQLKTKNIHFPRKDNLPYFALNWYNRPNNEFEKPLLHFLRQLTGCGSDLGRIDYPNA